MPIWTRWFKPQASARKEGQPQKSSKKHNQQQSETGKENSEAQTNQANQTQLSQQNGLYSINMRLSWLKEELKNADDISYRKITASSGQLCTLIFLKGMVDQATLQESIIQSLLQYPNKPDQELIQHLFEDKAITVSEMKILNDLSEVIPVILDAGVVLIIDNEPRMMAFPASSSYSTRSITESSNESVIRGPREAFIEDLDTNLTMLRRRLKSKNFKIERMTKGNESHTNFAIAYVEGICKPELLQELKRRLSYLQIDGIIGSSTIEECIEDSPFSPFPQMQYSERPDVISSSLLEGRIAIIVDGTPSAIILPVTLYMLMQTAEDYYQRYIAATWIRWIRYTFLVASLLLPSLYIAVTTFHPEMIPFKLLMTITSSREIVPFPAFVEAFMMELSFEALREASIRIPKSVGQAVSIIGALVIGTAAVQAGIVSAAMVIIVSLTGIASFIIPHFDLGLSIRLMRFPIMALASMLGLFGIICGVFLIYVHLLNLKSFGVPYLSPVMPFDKSDMTDTFIRVPWWAMRKRPTSVTNNQTRESSNLRGWAKQKEE